MSTFICQNSKNSAIAIYFPFIHTMTLDFMYFHGFLLIYRQ